MSQSITALHPLFFDFCLPAWNSSQCRSGVSYFVLAGGVLERSVTSMSGCTLTELDAKPGPPSSNFLTGGVPSREFTTSLSFRTQGECVVTPGPPSSNFLAGGVPSREFTTSL